VTKDVPARKIAVGMPAKITGDVPPDLLRPLGQGK
jgi:acetyltransferase-like isoleucine patch superfamily enzyme